MTAHAPITRQRLKDLIATGYKPGPTRVGVEVYRIRVNSRQGHELTIGEAAGKPVACLYGLQGSRKSLIQVWDIVS